MNDDYCEYNHDLILYATLNSQEVYNYAHIASAYVSNGKNAMGNTQLSNDLRLGVISSAIINFDLAYQQLCALTEYVRNCDDLTRHNEINKTAVSRHISHACRQFKKTTIAPLFTRRRAGKKDYKRHTGNYFL